MTPRVPLRVAISALAVVSLLTVGGCKDSPVTPTTTLPVVTLAPVVTPSATPTPTPTPSLSTTAPELTQEDIDQLLGPCQAFDPTGTCNSKSIIANLAAWQLVDGSNDYGSSILPIFPLYDYSNILAAPAQASLSVNGNTVSFGFIPPLSLKDYDPSAMSLTYDPGSDSVTVHSVRSYYSTSGSIYTVSAGTELYTLYQKATITPVTSDAWAAFTGDVQQAATDAAAYASFMKDPSQKDKYGNPIDKPNYPTFEPWVELQTLLVAKRGEGGHGSGFSSQTVVVSSFAEGVVAGLSALYSGVSSMKLDLDYAAGPAHSDDGTYSQIELLSPAVMNQVVNDCKSKTGWTDGHSLSAFTYPSTGVDAVRAMNLAIYTGMDY